MNKLHTELKALALSQQTNEKAYREAIANSDDPASVLEAFPSPDSRSELNFVRGQTSIHLHCPEFTALCPLTNQPDFGCIDIEYIPDGKCVESKSLKLYLLTFRNRGHFHEAVIAEIGNALVQLLDPKHISVRGTFMPRGGISINPVFNWHKQTL